MIPFDPEKTILLNIGIDVFSGMIILIIYHNFKSQHARRPPVALPHGRFLGLHSLKLHTMLDKLAMVKSFPPK